MTVGNGDNHWGNYGSTRLGGRVIYETALGYPYHKVDWPANRSTRTACGSVAYKLAILRFNGTARSSHCATTLALIVDKATIS